MKLQELDSSFPMKTASQLVLEFLLRGATVSLMLKQRHNKALDKLQNAHIRVCNTSKLITDARNIEMCALMHSIPLPSNGTSGST
ncbi:hypothetical protein NPIL_457041 [Nephila pilipes]|uniref:Uncharacterized protein n=1 Tax=Nephila pilipes TaxID=299642 RepID=A0A8X6P1X9_NEPPI|nr:hypothetical protein NPIL_457041 [Nephila pilipes]